MAPRDNITVPLAGDIYGGKPLQPTPETISIPKRLLEKDELVYRIAFAFHHITPGHFAIAEVRSTASTGELVVAVKDGKIYVGRWWAKHGAREVIVDEALEPIRGATIVAVINQIVVVNR